MTQSNTIDLSKLPAPDVVEPLDYETLFAQRKAELLTIMPELADTLALESEPLTIQLQVSAYRELNLRQRINQAAKSVMLAYAVDADLENLGALLGVPRLTLVEADPSANPPIEAVLESNTAYRERIQLSLDGLSTAGPEQGYVYHARSADPRVKDAKVDAPTFTRATLDPGVEATLPAGAIVLIPSYDAGLAEPSPGDVVISVLSNNGDGTAPSDLLTAVESAVNGEDTRPTTDHVIVQSATIINYTVEAELTIYPGPDGTTVLESAQQAVAAYVSDNHRLGRDITISGLHAALHKEGVQNVALTAPVADIEVSKSEAAYCTAIDITLGGTDE
ncbi:baseplate J-like protein [gamma proteobacterium HTCC5015]|nr:baseplate J-like protein [gamma proteobacterium HTCC5015]